MAGTAFRWQVMKICGDGMDIRMAKKVAEHDKTKHRSGHLPYWNPPGRI
jgi:hypothetical protein